MSYKAIETIAILITDLREDSGRGSTRDISLAITKLEEAAMWLQKGLANTLKGEGT